MSKGPYARFGKRTADLVLGGLLFLVGVIPGLLVALLVRLDSRGPALYRQTRVGRNGRPFEMLKFRSMVVGAESKGAGILVEQNDARITRMGKFLRKTSLDETPQLLNILKGEMSVIGPRPGLDYQAKQYSDEQRRRLLVRPGVTGWAQVHGRNSIPWDDRIRYDVEYVDNVTLAMDVKILVGTVRVVLKGADQIAAKDYFREKENASTPERAEAEKRRTGS